MSSLFRMVFQTPSSRVSLPREPTSYALWTPTILDICTPPPFLPLISALYSIPSLCVSFFFRVKAAAPQANSLCFSSTSLYTAFSNASYERQNTKQLKHSILMKWLFKQYLFSFFPGTVSKLTSEVSFIQNKSLANLTSFTWHLTGPSPLCAPNTHSMCILCLCVTLTICNSASENFFLI